MADIQPGFTYGDPPNNILNAQNLNEHVANAVILPAFISAKPLKSPAALSDKFVIEVGGVLKMITAQQLHDLILYPGSVVQTIYAEYTANTNLTSIIPANASIPQNTQGTQILTASITPRFPTSTILARFQTTASASIAVIVCSALFRDSIVDAIDSTVVTIENITYLRPMVMEYMDSPATMSPVTYQIRVGPASAATMRLNGTTSGPIHGGGLRSTLVLQEIKV